MTQSVAESTVHLALARLRGRLPRALKSFRRITGVTAVASLASFGAQSHAPMVLTPPLHPSCARRLRAVGVAPCSKQWQSHLKATHHPIGVVSHTCPIGLRCSFVPIRLDGRLVGAAKLVMNSETPDADFSSTTEVLKLVASRTAERCLLSLLSDQVISLRQRVADLSQVHVKSGNGSDAGTPPHAGPGPGETGIPGGGVVQRTLAYLAHHYRDPGFSLAAVADAMGRNPSYLTDRFTQDVGESMHRYVTGLRVGHACELLLGTSLSVKQVGYAVGFSSPTTLARTFRRRVGVSPSEYRRIFTAI